CLPRFASPGIVGRLVGGREAGHFRLGPGASSPLLARRYLPHTPTIETVWQCPGGRLILPDGMVAEPGRRLVPTSMLVRRLRAEGGSVDASLSFDPRRGEHRDPPRRARHDG